ncbi:hypothetical protein V2J56_03295 [Georgenia sp. MJ206]|uniref:hypothetical protein n=1 Tax=Georgenia wangjunii TaxID=3117730 RepID=UPI002F26AA5F
MATSTGNPVAAVAPLPTQAGDVVLARRATGSGRGRLADVLEALCVSAALPLAVWPAGLAPWIHALVA